MFQKEEKRNTRKQKSLVNSHGVDKAWPKLQCLGKSARRKEEHFETTTFHECFSIFALLFLPPSSISCAYMKWKVKTSVLWFLFEWEMPSFEKALDDSKSTICLLFVFTFFFEIKHCLMSKKFSPKLPFYFIDSRANQWMAIPFGRTNQRIVCFHVKGSILSRRKFAPTGRVRFIWLSVNHWNIVCFDSI